MAPLGRIEITKEMRRKGTVGEILQKLFPTKEISEWGRGPIEGVGFKAMHADTGLWTRQGELIGVSLSTGYGANNVRKAVMVAKDGYFDLDKLKAKFEELREIDAAWSTRRKKEQASERDDYDRLLALRQKLGGPTFTGSLQTKHGNFQLALSLKDEEEVIKVWGAFQGVVAERTTKQPVAKLVGMDLESAIKAEVDKTHRTQGISMSYTEGEASVSSVAARLGLDKDSEKFHSLVRELSKTGRLRTASYRNAAKNTDITYPGAPHPVATGTLGLWAKAPTGSAAEKEKPPIPKKALPAAPAKDLSAKEKKNLYMKEWRAKKKAPKS